MLHLILTRYQLLTHIGPQCKISSFPTMPDPSLPLTSPQSMLGLVEHLRSKFPNAKFRFEQGGPNVTPDGPGSGLRDLAGAAPSGSAVAGSPDSELNASSSTAAGFDKGPKNELSPNSVFQNESQQETGGSYFSGAFIDRVSGQAAEGDVRRITDASSEKPTPVSGENDENDLLLEPDDNDLFLRPSCSDDDVNLDSLLQQSSDVDLFGDQISASSGDNNKRGPTPAVGSSTEAVATQGKQKPNRKTQNHDSLRKSQAAITHFPSGRIGARLEAMAAGCGVPQDGSTVFQRVKSLPNQFVPEVRVSASSFETPLFWFSGHGITDTTRCHECGEFWKPTAFSHVRQIVGVSGCFFVLGVAGCCSEKTCPNPGPRTNISRTSLHGVDLLDTPFRSFSAMRMKYESSRDGYSWLVETFLMDMIRELMARGVRASSISHMLSNAHRASWFRAELARGGNPFRTLAEKEKTPGDVTERNTKPSQSGPGREPPKMQVNNSAEDKQGKRLVMETTIVLLFGVMMTINF